MESILAFVVFVALIGFLVYLITTYVPMAAPFKDVIVAGCAIVLVLWLVAILFGHASLPTLPRFGG